MPITIDIHAPNLDARSDLLKAQSRAVRGKVNACPFGCGWKHLDDHGYCRHLIGFSNDGRTFEPMIKDPATGRRVVRCRMEKVEEIAEYDDDGKAVMVPVHQPRLERVKPGDVLIRISTSHRVYRDVGGKAPTKRTEALEGTQDEITQAALENLTRTVPNRSFQTAPTEDFAVVAAEE